VGDDIGCGTSASGHAIDKTIALRDVAKRELHTTLILAALGVCETGLAGIERAKWRLGTREGLWITGVATAVLFLLLGETLVT
jgi:hypothetical protein